MVTATPVSYTHLDVYKRQLQQRPTRQAINLERPLRLIVSTVYEPAGEADRRRTFSEAYHASHMVHVILPTVDDFAERSHSGGCGEAKSAVGGARGHVGDEVRLDDTTQGSSEGLSILEANYDFVATTSACLLYTSRCV